MSIIEHKHEQWEQNRSRPRHKRAISRELRQSIIGLFWSIIRQGLTQSLLRAGRGVRPHTITLCACACNNGPRKRGRQPAYFIRQTNPPPCFRPLALSVAKNSFWVSILTQFYNVEIAEELRPRQDETLETFETIFGKYKLFV